MIYLPFFVVTVTHPSLLGEPCVSATTVVSFLSKELGSATLMTSTTVKSMLDTSFVIGIAITGSKFSFVTVLSGKVHASAPDDVTRLKNS